MFIIAKIMIFGREEFLGWIHLIQMNSKDLSCRIFGKCVLQNNLFYYHRFFSPTTSSIFIP